MGKGGEFGNVGEEAPSILSERKCKEEGLLGGNKLAFVLMDNEEGGKLLLFVEGEWTVELLCDELEVLFACAWARELVAAILGDEGCRAGESAPAPLGETALEAERLAWLAGAAVEAERGLRGCASRKGSGRRRTQS